MIYKQYTRKQRLEKVKELRKLQDYDCNGCRDTAAYTYEELTIDHIKPRTYDGPDTVYNLQLLCKQCNSRKHKWGMDYLWKHLKDIRTANPVSV